MRELNRLKKQVETLQATAATQRPSAPTDPWGKPIADTPEGRRQALIDGLAGSTPPSCLSEFGADDPRASREYLEALSHHEVINLWCEVTRLHRRRTETDEDTAKREWFRSLPLAKQIGILTSGDVSRTVNKLYPRRTHANC